MKIAGGLAARCACIARSEYERGTMLQTASDTLAPFCASLVDDNPGLVHGDLDAGCNRRTGRSRELA